MFAASSNTRQADANDQAVPGQTDRSNTGQAEVDQNFVRSNAVQDADIHQHGSGAHPTAHASIDQFNEELAKLQTILQNRMRLNGSSYFLYQLI